MTGHRIFRRSRGNGFVLGSTALAFLTCLGTVFGLDDADDARKRELAEMRRRAEGTKISVIAGGDKRTTAELVPSPVMSYTDEPRRIVGATLWVLGKTGRPAALCKVEHYDNPQRTNPWFYCLGSLSPELIAVEFQDGQTWEATKPGMELKDLPDSPAPSDTRAGRLRQLKDLSRRFSGTLTDTPINRRQEMRLLPQPLYRYENASAGLVDGALFGLTSNGTNPDAILAVELHQDAQKKATWQFALAGMTDGEVSIVLDRKLEVWQKPYTFGKAKQPAMVYLWETTAEGRK